MSVMNSKEIKLGMKLQHFALEDPNGKAYSSKELIGESGLLIFVTCNHCPYSSILWDRLVEITEFAKKIDVGVVALNPNIHPNYPEDSPSHMIDKIKEYNLNFPYLIDGKQMVVKSLGAVCTPDIFLFDGEEKLFYHGRIDDEENNKKIQKEELREALMALFSGHKPPKNQQPSRGCSIKWADTILG